MREGQSVELALLVGGALLVFIAALLLSAALAFAVGASLSRLNLLLAAIAVTGFVGWATRRDVAGPRGTVRVVVAVITVGTFGGAILISSAFYDLSYDGQMYHQVGILHLARGWNPFRASLTVSDTQNQLWVNHYPKGSWIAAATLFMLTDRIELGKAFNLVLMVAAFSLAWAAVVRLWGSVGWALVVGLLAVLNPVSVTQAFSFTVDGQLASLLVCVVALGYLASEAPGPALVSFGAAIVILANLKFTGLVYAAFFGLGVIALSVAMRETQHAARCAGVLATALVLGVALVGFNPYVTNALSHGHPFYPLAGADAVDIMTYNRPANLQGKGRLTKLLLSVFSSSANPVTPASGVLKLPWVLSSRELSAFVIPAARMGGFGPLFGGALLLAIVVFVALTWHSPRQMRVWLAAALALVVSVLVHPEGWWARYAPQLWMVPVLAVMLALLSAPRRPIIGTALLLTLVANIFLVAASSVAGQVILNRRLDAQRQTLAHATQPVEVALFNFESNRHRLERWGVLVREVQAPSCSNPIQLVGSRTQACVRP